MTSKRDDWRTPKELFFLLHSEFDFTIDAAANRENRLLPRWFGPGSPIAENCLTHLWTGERAYLNPPYGSVIGSFVGYAHKMAAAHMALTVCLVPARTDTRWWWDYARYGEVRLLKGRLKFDDGKMGATFPSAVIVFRPGLPDKSIYHWEGDYR